MSKQKVMVNVLRITRHEDKEMEKGPVASYGFNVVLAGKQEPTAELQEGKFVWINDLVNIGAGDKVIEAYDSMKEKLAQDGVKSIFAELTYHVNKKGYMVIDSLYRRDKQAKPATKEEAKA